MYYERFANGSKRLFELPTTNKKKGLSQKEATLFDDFSDQDKSSSKKSNPIEYDFFEMTWLNFVHLQNNEETYFR